MFGSSFGASLPSTSGSAASSSGASNLFGKSSGNTNTTPSAPAAPSLPFAGFGSTKPSSSSSSGNTNTAPKFSMAAPSGGFSFGGGGGGAGGSSISSSPLNAKASSAAPTSLGVPKQSTTSFGANMFAPKPQSTATTSNASPAASSSLPFGGFASSSATSSKKSASGLSFSGAASAAAAKSHSTTTTALVPAPTAALTSTTSSAITTTSNIRSSKNNITKNQSVDNSCISPDGRSFHSYLYDATLDQHVIISEFAPFGESSTGSGVPSDVENNISSMKITTKLPLTIAECINIDPVIGLICVDGSNEDGSKSTRHRLQRREDRGKNMSSLPWMCLYTRTSAFLLSIGYEQPEEEDDNKQSISGTILHTVEPFEKQLLMSPRGSAILRIRPAPTSNTMFQRCGSMAMLLREGGNEDNTVVGHVLVLYHGLPESMLGSRRGGGRDFGGRRNISSEGSVTVPLRFDNEDLVRGRGDTMDAENEAYNSSSLRDQPPSSSLLATKIVTDFCFMNPSQTSTSGASGFASSSILVLTSDGCVYGACPIIFDGTVLPRTVVVSAISHLDGEIEASDAFLASLAPSPVASFEQEQVEARTRQCRAARRYLLDVFGIPTGMAGQQQSGGSFYVSASVVHSRSYSLSDDSNRMSQALAWQPRLQGPLVASPQSASQSDYSSPPTVCIEPFGGAAGAGIIDGFVVARSGSVNKEAGETPIHVEFGILPGEGAVMLPRFEFESDGDCQLIDELVRGTGMYVERASIMNDKKSEDKYESDESPSRALVSSTSDEGRDCCIVVDPLDDIMVHVMTRSRIATVTTNGVAVTAARFKSRMSGSMPMNNQMISIRTKVWSGLEVSSNDAALVGGSVSSDVHLGHVLLARVASGSMEVVNITAAQCLHETSEQMKAKSKDNDASIGDDKNMEVLRKVKPLNELLQPLVDKVCDGLSKMGKIVGAATLPKEAGPEDLAILLDTQHSCEVNILVPMEEMSGILIARRDLLQEMYNHQAAELVRLTALLDEFKANYESNLKRVVDLEAKASILAERSSAVLTASRDLRPKVTDAESAYFKDLRRYETSCNKWDSAVNQLQRDAASTCDAISAGAIENGDVRCLVNLPPEKIETCHKLLRGEKQALTEFEQKVKASSSVVEMLSRTISGLDSADIARLRLAGGDKENQQS